MVQINRQRFLTSLAEMAQIGRVPVAEGDGLNRAPFSPADRAARARFCEMALQAGLDIATDEAANLSARLASGSEGAKTLLLGSHLDTVPHGGPYDGALGVMAALEVLTVVAENEIHLPFHLEAIDFTDEEGRFGDFFGSRALAGAHNNETLSSFFERIGSFPDDLEAMREMVTGGLSPSEISNARRAPDTLTGFLELHIEQGPRLEHAGIPIGVVSAIFGRTSFKLTFNGRPDHAGTTPMNLRSDAFVAAAEFVTRAPAQIREQVPAAVLTCGGITVEPNVYNVVPSQATILVEYRAATDNELSRIDTILGQLITEISRTPGISSTIEPVSQHDPVAMDDKMQRVIGDTAKALGYAALDMPSGAGHDAQMMAAITPTGMLFVPSIGGRSHCPDEKTADDDLVAGTEVLLQAVLQFAEPPD